MDVMLVRLNSKIVTGKMEIRIDSPNGKIIGAAYVKATGAWEDWYVSNVVIPPMQEQHDLYFIFANPVANPPTGEASMLNFHWIKFNH